VASLKIEDAIRFVSRRQDDKKQILLIIDEIGRSIRQVAEEKSVNWVDFIWHPIRNAIKNLSDTSDSKNTNTDPLHVVLLVSALDTVIDVVDQRPTGTELDWYCVLPPLPTELFFSGHNLHFNKPMQVQVQPYLRLLSGGCPVLFKRMVTAYPASSDVSSDPRVAEKLPDDEFVTPVVLQAVIRREIHGAVESVSGLKRVRWGNLPGIAKIPVIWANRKSYELFLGYSLPPSTLLKSNVFNFLLTESLISKQDLVSLRSNFRLASTLGNPDTWWSFYKKIFAWSLFLKFYFAYKAPRKAIIPTKSSTSSSNGVNAATAAAAAAAAVDELLPEDKHGHYFGPFQNMSIDFTHPPHFHMAKTVVDVQTTLKSFLNTNVSDRGPQGITMSKNREAIDCVVLLPRINSLSPCCVLVQNKLSDESSTSRFVGQTNQERNKINSIKD